MYSSRRRSFIVHRSRKATTDNKEQLNKTIILAVRSGDVKETEELINKGADIDITENGRNLLMLAISNEQKDVAKLLISRGINLNYRNNQPGDHDQYKSGLDLAEEKGWDDIYELIERTSLANKNIPMAVDDGDAKLTKSLLGQGADINTITDTGESLLMRAIRHRHWEVCELLINQGIDVAYVLELKHETSNGKYETTRETARTYALRYQMPDVIQLIDKKLEEYKEQGITVDDRKEEPTRGNKEKIMNDKEPGTQKQSHTCRVL
ncbi:ankyrin repeat, SAM and basic leucine zipper domain-containing protein 1-like isoform X2 [Ptychodera flava]|uniref:ankyrin repeat, SAM and basic leucine zipper domain-containing protein 1-like isoform X2 n=1 Tax=Ptychodera flava TaxID=63121 RepID=UPI00396A522E